MRHDQIRPPYGMGRFQQIMDLSMSRGLPRGRELRWITHHPEGIELAQIVEVQMDALKGLVVMHVLQGWPYGVRVIGLHLPVLGKVADHGISSCPAGKAFGNLLAPPGIKISVHTPGPLPAPVMQGLIGQLFFLTGGQLFRLMGRHFLFGTGLVLLLPPRWGPLLMNGLPISLLVSAKDVTNT